MANMTPMEQIIAIIKSFHVPKRHCCAFVKKIIDTRVLSKFMAKSSHAFQSSSDKSMRSYVVGNKRTTQFSKHGIDTVQKT